jgi:hypothetical protein
MPRIDFNIDKNNLYREESVTDLKVGAIRSLLPIKADGTRDETRQTIYIGNTQLMSPQGAVPIQAQLEAATLEEAIDNFPEAMKQAMEQMIEEIQEMQAERNRSMQQKESRIIMPGR